MRVPRAGSLAADLGPYVAILAVIGALSIVVRTVDEAALPDLAATPLPGLIDVDGFALARLPGVPAFRAARAIPAAPDRAVAIGGTWAGLRLEAIEIDLDTVSAAGWRITAGRGELVDRSLRLEEVRVRDGDRIALIGGLAVIRLNRIRFDGPVVVAPDSAARVVDRDLVIALADLPARLAGR